MKLTVDITTIIKMSTNVENQLIEFACQVPNTKRTH